MSDLKDFVELSLDELKFFLQQRGQPYSDACSPCSRTKSACHRHEENIVASLKQDYTSLLSTRNLPDPGIMKDDLLINEDVITWQNKLHIRVSRPKNSLCGNFYDFLIMFDRFLTGCQHCMNNKWRRHQEVINFKIGAQKWIPGLKICLDK